MKVTIKPVVTMVKTELSSAIMASVEGSSELKSEMNKVFKRANTRINALKDSGEYRYSTAYRALGNLTDRGGRTTFTTAGYTPRLGADSPRSWQELKHEYALAVAFLNNEDSTLSGARNRSKDIRDTIEATLLRKLTEDEWDDIVQSDLYSFADNNEYLGKYRTMFERFLDVETEDTERQMQQTAQEVERQVQASIEEQVEDLVNFVMNDMLGRGFN